MNKLIIFLLFLILLVQLGMLYTITYEKLESSKVIKSVDNYFYEKNVTGMNIPKCGFFVDTRGRKFEKVNDTEHHEVCEELIIREREHFCGE